MSVREQRVERLQWLLGIEMAARGCAGLLMDQGTIECWVSQSSDIDSLHSFQCTACAISNLNFPLKLTHILKFTYYSSLTLSNNIRVSEMWCAFCIPYFIRSMAPIFPHGHHIWSRDVSVNGCQGPSLRFLLTSQRSGCNCHCLTPSGEKKKVLDKTWRMDVSGMDENPRGKAGASLKKCSLTSAMLSMACTMISWGKPWTLLTLSFKWFRRIAHLIVKTFKKYFSQLNLFVCSFVCMPTCNLF